MEKLAQMKLSIASLPFGSQQFDYHVDGKFFNEIEVSEVRSGSVDVAISVTHTQEGIYDLDFVCNGVITIPCDRCLDDMEQSVETDNRLIVKLGSETSEEDDMIVVNEDEGILDMSWIIYEFIVLAIPIRHVHAPGKCNPAMTQALEELSADRSSDEESNQPIDPRWEKLKKLNITD